MISQLIETLNTCIRLSNDRHIRYDTLIIDCNDQDTYSTTKH